MAVLTSAELDSIVHHRSLDDALQDWSSDVGLYFETTIPKIASGFYADFTRDHPDELRRLVGRAAGVFIYARVAVNSLSTYDDHPEEQFALLLSREGGAGLSPLGALYFQVLRSAFPPADLHGAPSRQERLRLLLHFIVAQSRLLHPTQLALLGSGSSQMSEEDVVRMVDRLHSVLLINQGGEVTPLHATFRKFLLDSKRCVDLLYHVNKAKGEVFLALGCLVAFSVKNVTDFLANPDSAMGEYVMHATLSWSEHCRKAQYDEELENRLRTFVQSDVQAVYQRLRQRIVKSLNTLLILQVAEFLQVSNEPLFCIY